MIVFFSKQAMSIVDEVFFVASTWPIGVLNRFEEMFIIPCTDKMWVTKVLMKVDADAWCRTIVSASSMIDPNDGNSKWRFYIIGPDST